MAECFEVFPQATISIAGARVWHIMTSVLRRGVIRPAGPADISLLIAMQIRPTCDDRTTHHEVTLVRGFCMRRCERLPLPSPSV
jgi:hypothetical protein